MSSMTAIPQNYKNNVDWILGAYEDAGCYSECSWRKKNI